MNSETRDVPCNGGFTANAPGYICRLEADLSDWIHEDERLGRDTVPGDIYALAQSEALDACDLLHPLARQLADDFGDGG